ncbi:MAG: hypothetical protein LBB65_07925 [Burkholderiales bacterium]|jgi:hypothetical protein|nr:hypothetical protein [Burkholderiales bacterium]
MPENQIETPSVEAKKAPVAAMWIVMILAWVCFLLPFPFTGIFIGAPLTLAAFILAIVCLAKNRVAHGVIGLFGTLIVSTVLFFAGGAVFYGKALQEEMQKQQQLQKQQQQNATPMKHPAPIKPGQARAAHTVGWDKT